MENDEDHHHHHSPQENYENCHVTGGGAPDVVIVKQPGHVTPSSVVKQPISEQDSNDVITGHKVDGVIRPGNDVLMREMRRSVMNRKKVGSHNIISIIRRQFFNVF